MNIPNVQVTNFQSTIYNIQLIPNPTPVELVSFNAIYKRTFVELNWKTATELNNKGFNVERNQRSKVKGQSGWEKIGFINGKGTTTEMQSYSFLDNNPIAGTIQYRLKQMDFDGGFKYSNVVEVETQNLASNYFISQNYPNPFNPTTQIKYSIPEKSVVSVKVYDILGNEISTLVNEEKNAGNYLISFNGNKLSSGLYFYTINAGKYRATKKMLIVK